MKKKPMNKRDRRKFGIGALAGILFLTILTTLGTAIGIDRKGIIFATLSCAVLKIYADITEYLENKTWRKR